MVGHTGNMPATIIGVETVDLNLERILKAVREANGVAVITADHGNADEMFEIDKKTKLPSSKAKTAHTLNPVPCIFYDDNYGGKYTVKEGSFRLSNLAATFANLLGYDAPSFWDESMIEIK
jgi:2,3-bisphosphoglycerate-independent phosphoglycerate mutase